MKLQSWKGQAAIEYMTVFGIALLLAAPFVLKAQQSIVELQSGSNKIAVQDSLNDIETAVRTVSAAGEPALTRFTVSIPRTVNSTEVNTNSVEIVLDTPSGYSTSRRFFNFNLTGELPSEPGLYVLEAQAVNGSVNIEVVS
ncbi:MAG: hypothetical protein ABEJ98_02175 [Candidatus Nanohaloarchaea archaeon]